MNWELERLFGCMDRGREQKLPPAQLTLRYSRCLLAGGVLSYSQIFLLEIVAVLSFQVGIIKKVCCRRETISMFHIFSVRKNVYYLCA